VPHPELGFSCLWLYYDILSFWGKVGKSQNLGLIEIEMMGNEKGRMTYSRK
jgi:hypothetical protein